MSDNNEATPNEAAIDDDEIVIGMAEDEANADASDTEAPVLERREDAASNGLKRAIFNVPIEVVVSVGTARPLIGDLLSMGRNHLLPLENKIDDPVELRVKDRVIARGELTQMPDNENQLGIRLTEIINMAELSE